MAFRRDVAFRRARPHAGADRLLAGELGPVQVRVQPAGREQLLVTAALADPPVVDDQDLVGLADGRQPVGDDQRGAAGQRGPERLLDGGLRLGVQVRGGLVEHHHGRCLQQQPGQGDPLLLAAGQPVAAVTHDRVQAVGQRGDQVPDLRRPACLDQFRLGSPRGGRTRGWPGSCRGTGARPGSPRRPRRAATPESRPAGRTRRCAPCPRWGRTAGTPGAVIVVLPAPDGPTRAVSCRAGAVKLMSWSTPSLASVRSGTGRAIDSSEASETSDAAG